MKERLFLGASLLAGIALVGVIGVALRGLLFVAHHLSIVWN